MRRKTLPRSSAARSPPRTDRPRGSGAMRAPGRGSAAQWSRLTPPPPPPSDGQRRNGFWVPPLPAPRGRPPGSGPRGALGRGRGSGAGSRRGAARSPFAHFLDGRHHPLDIILRPAPGLGPHRPARHAAEASWREGRGRAAASAAGMRRSARLAASVPPSCPHAQCSHGSARFGAARLRSAPLGSARPPGPARCARAARSAGGSPRAREAGGALRGDPPMAADGGFVGGGRRVSCEAKHLRGVGRSLLRDTRWLSGFSAASSDSGRFCENASSDTAVEP